METFSAFLANCAGNSPVPGEFRTQRPVTWSFDVFIDLHLNKRSGKNREAGDLRRHRSHYDVTVMQTRLNNINANRNDVRKIPHNHCYEALAGNMHFMRDSWVQNSSTRNTHLPIDGIS